MKLFIHAVARARSTLSLARAAEEPAGLDIRKICGRMQDDVNAGSGGRERSRKATSRFSQG